VSHQSTSASGQCRHLKTSGFTSDTRKQLYGHCFRELIIFNVIFLMILIFLCMSCIKTGKITVNLFYVDFVGLFPPVPVFIVHKYRSFDVGRPRAVSSASGSVGV